MLCTKFDEAWSSGSTKGVKYVKSLQVDEQKDLL